MVLKEEIDRIREIMGLKIISESISSPIGGILDNIFRKFLIGNDENLKKIIKDSISSVRSYDEVSEILNQITKGTKTISDLEKEFPGLNFKNILKDVLSQSNYKKYLDKTIEIIGENNPELSQSLKNAQDEISIDFKALAKSEPDLHDEIVNGLITTKNTLDEFFADDPELSELIKVKIGLDKIPNLVVKPFKDIEISLITSLKNQNLEISKKFREKWFSMMKKVENRLGEPWKATDEEKEKLSTILSAINEKTKGDTIYFTLPVSGKTVKIQPQEILQTQLSNYKLIYNKDGSVSSLNKIDTHTQDSVNLFFDYINRQSNSEDIIKTINEQMEKGETTKIEEVLSKMESDDSFWDDIIKNGDDVTKKIAETTATGTAREQLVVSNAKKLFGDDWEVEFQAYEGHPLDRLLGVDLVLKNAAGEYKFVQVKSVNSVNVYEADFGVVAKMYNKDLKLQKPSQLDNIVYVSPKNEVVVASKNRILKYSKELEDLIPTNKVGFKGPNMYGYSELIADTYVVIEDSPKGTILVKTK